MWVWRVDAQEFKLTLFAFDGSPRSEHEHAQRQGEDSDTLTQTRCFKVSPLSLAASPPLPSSWCALPLSPARGAAHASPLAIAAPLTGWRVRTQAPKRKADATAGQSAPKAKKRSTAAADSPAKSSRAAAASSSSSKARVKGASATASSSSKSKSKNQAEITIVESDSSGDDDSDSDVIIESPKKGKKTTPSSKGKGASKSTKDENDKKKKSVGKGESHAQHEVLIATAALAGGSTDLVIYGTRPDSLGQGRRAKQGCACLARAARLDLDAGRHDPRRGNQGQEGLLLLQVEIDQAPLVRRRL